MTTTGCCANFYFPAWPHTTCFRRRRLVEAAPRRAGQKWQAHARPALTRDQAQNADLSRARNHVAGLMAAGLEGLCGMTSVAPTLVMEKLQGSLNVPDSRVKRLGMPANPANLVAESLGSAHPTGLTWSSEGSISKHLKPRTNPAQTLHACGEQRRRN